MARMHKRILLTLAMAIVASLAVSAVAHAAPGTVTVNDSGDHKVIQYTGGADADVTFGGSIGDHTVTVTEAGVTDPGATADPGNICRLSAPDTLTCTDPKLGVNDWYGGSAYMGTGGDTVTVTGTQQWIVNGADGDDEITGSDQADDLLSGGPGNDVIDGLGNSGSPTTRTASTAGPTTMSCAAARARTPSTEARATTRSSAGTATTTWVARMAWTPSMATPATTGWKRAPATASCPTAVMAATSCCAWETRARPTTAARASTSSTASEESRRAPMPVTTTT